MAIKVLMVCLGNICRSPLAEGILQSKVNSDLVFVDSAGTGGYHIGSKPDTRSIAIGLKYNIDIRNQRCRKFTPKDFDDFDLIYVMDKSNYDNVIVQANNDQEIAKVKLLLNEIGPGDNQVPDPYYDNNGFEHVFKLIDEACEVLADRLNSN